MLLHKEKKGCYIDTRLLLYYSIGLIIDLNFFIFWHNYVCV